MQKKKYRWLSLFLVIAVLVTGCSESDISDKLKQMNAGSTATTDDTSEIDYTVPVSRPYALIDRTGYLPDSDKTVIFLGTNVPDSFQVIDLDTGECVYTGTISQKGVDSDSGQMISYGSFTGLTQEGTYEIKCDVIGYSYSFAIGEDVYDTLKEDLTDRLSAAEEDMTGNDSDVLMGGLEKNIDGCGNIVTGCETADIILLAYELYPAYFDQELTGTAGGARVPEILDLIRDETDWMFTMQDPDSGGVYAGVRSHGGEGISETETEEDLTQELSPTATAYYAATMAKFCYQYQQYDSTYADKCLKAAEQAWNYLEEQEDNDTITSEMLFAAVELYRLTGKAEYQSYILANEDEIEDGTSECDFLAQVTYLLTVKEVDTSLCDVLVDHFMEDSEDISGESENNLFQIDAQGSGESIQNILWNMVRIGVVDYIITNHEYTTVIENNVHYLLGCNLESKVYLQDNTEENTEDTETIKTLPQTAEMLLLLDIITSEKEMITSS